MPSNCSGVLGDAFKRQIGFAAPAEFLHGRDQFGARGLQPESQLILQLGQIEIADRAHLHLAAARRCEIVVSVQVRQMGIAIVASDISKTYKCVFELNAPLDRPQRQGVIDSEVACHVANLSVEPYLFADAGLGQAAQLADARVDPRLFNHHLAGLNAIESAFQTR